MSNFFPSDAFCALRAECSGNITVGNATTSNHSVRVTSGVSNKLTIDICGLLDRIPDSTGKTIRLRIDTYAEDGVTSLNSIVTPSLYLNDISAVTGNISATKANIGKKLDAATNLPLYFRTLCGDGLDVANRAIRVTMDDSEALYPLKNGYKVNIMTDWLDANKDVNISTADVSFSRMTTNVGQLTVNGGPLGANNGIPAFTAAMTKNADDNANGDIKITTASPLFKDAGKGIDLSSATFRIKEAGVNGAEQFKTITMADNANESAGANTYDLKTVTGATGKSYMVVGTSVTDAFKEYGYAMQNASNGMVNFSNKAEAIDGATIAINADSSGLDATFKTGTKTVVSFDAPDVAEGEKSITKYEARWATKAQADVLGGNINFARLATAHPTQVASVSDICATTTFVDRNITLTGLSSSVINSNGTADDNTRLGVFVRAYSTGDNGGVVAGKDTADVSASKWVGSGTTVLTATNGGADVSLGFYVSAVPAAPTHVTVKTGKSLLLSNTNTDTAAKKDASMNKQFTLVFNDYNVNQRGSHYDSIRYAIINSSDVQYAGDMADASFSSVAATYGGNDAATEQELFDGAGAVTMKYDTVNSAWTTVADDTSNGSSYAIQYAFDNSNGMGFRSPWSHFTPSAHPDAKAGLFGLDASSNTRTGAAGAGWGYGVAVAAGNAAKISNNAAFIASAATNDERVNLDNANKKLAFGFSLLDASGHENKAAGLAYRSPETLDGGSDVTSIRYFVNKATALANAEPSALATARVYGAPSRDVSGNASTPTKVGKVQTVTATKNTNRLSVTQGYDASGALTNLRNGQRYDICFGLVNANGFNDASMSVLAGFAPLGAIQGVKNLRVGTTKPALNANSFAVFDISFDDLSGVAEHGGHLINRYTFRVTQDQGGADPVVLIAADTSDAVNTYSGLASIFSATNTASRKHTLTTAAALAGYPMKVSVTASAMCTDAATGVTATAQGANRAYQQGVAKDGATVTITVPGPTLQVGSEHDEVRGLQVAALDGKLKVSFYKPQNDSLLNQYDSAPTVDSYKIYAYDMSMTAFSNKLALSRSVTTINDSADIASDFLEKEISGLNGKCYTVAVHTNWRYGPNQNDTQLTKGVYSTSAASATNVNDPSLNATTGIWTLPANAGSQSVAACSVPRGVPSITSTNSTLQFDDNGSEITVGALVQFAPQNVAGGTSAFYLDICGTTGGDPRGNTTVKSLKGPNGHQLNRKTYDICATAILGTNWATEKNFIIIQNAAGSAYQKRNIA